jgi:hypothetical protein
MEFTMERKFQPQKSSATQKLMAENRNVVHSPTARRQLDKRSNNFDSRRRLTVHIRVGENKHPGDADLQPIL